MGVQHGPVKEYAAAVGLSRMADFTVIVSHELAESLRRGWFFRRVCPSARMRVILNGVDEEFWRHCDAGRRADGHVGLPVGESAVGMIGTLVTHIAAPASQRASPLAGSVRYSIWNLPARVRGEPPWRRWSGAKGWPTP